MTHQFNLKTLKSQNGKKYGMCLFYLPSPLHTSFTMDSDFLPETLKHFSKLIEIAFPQKFFARKSKKKKKKIKQKEKMKFFLLVRVIPICRNRYTRSKLTVKTPEEDVKSKLTKKTLQRPHQTLFQCCYHILSHCFYRLFVTDKCRLGRVQ